MDFCVFSLYHIFSFSASTFAAFPKIISSAAPKKECRTDRYGTPRVLMLRFSGHGGPAKVKDNLAILQHKNRVEKFSVFALEP